MVGMDIAAIEVVVVVLTLQELGLAQVSQIRIQGDQAWRLPTLEQAIMLEMEELQTLRLHPKNTELSSIGYCAEIRRKTKEYLLVMVIWLLPRPVHLLHHRSHSQRLLDTEATQRQLLRPRS